MPFSTDVQTFLRSLDCLVVPSRYAGMENVALEGMLCGTPTLAPHRTVRVPLVAAASFLCPPVSLEQRLCFARKQRRA